MNKINLSFCVCLCWLLSSCSVYKAASNSGVSVGDIKKCYTKECFLSHGMEIVDRHEGSGTKYIETYRAIARKSGVNYARAVGHGALDVMTLGLWEVAGTPMEGAMSNNRGYITVKATYSCKNAEKIISREIYGANGKLEESNNF